MTTFSYAIFIHLFYLIESTIFDQKLASNLSLNLINTISRVDYQSEEPSKQINHLANDPLERLSNPSLSQTRDPSNLVFFLKRQVRSTKSNETLRDDQQTTSQLKSSTTTTVATKLSQVSLCFNY